MQIHLVGQESHANTVDIYLRFLFLVICHSISLKLTSFKSIRQFRCQWTIKDVGLLCQNFTHFKKKFVVGVSLKKKLLLKMAFYNSELHMPDLSVIIFRSKKKKYSFFGLKTRISQHQTCFPRIRYFKLFLYFLFILFVSINQIQHLLEKSV